MATASSMILAALVLTGDKVIGGSLSAAEQTYYLERLNSMLESWSLERLMVPSLLQESLALTTSVGSYTIGVGGAFNTARPNKIVDPSFIRDAAGLDFPLEIIDAQTYGRIVLKTIGDTYPRYLFYDTAFVAGLGTIFLWPEPSAGLTLFINSWKQLQSFAAITDTAALPPGYQLAIESNFAVYSAAGFKPISAELAKIARESKAAVKGINAPTGILRVDPGLVGHGRYDIRTG